MKVCCQAVQRLKTFISIFIWKGNINEPLLQPCSMTWLSSSIYYFTNKDYIFVLLFLVLLELRLELWFELCICSSLEADVMRTPCAETRGGRCHHLPVVPGALGDPHQSPSQWGLPWVQDAIHWAPTWTCEREQNEVWGGRFVLTTDKQERSGYSLTRTVVRLMEHRWLN